MEQEQFNHMIDLGKHFYSAHLEGHLYDSEGMEYTLNENEQGFLSFSVKVEKYNGENSEEIGLFLAEMGDNIIKDYLKNKYQGIEETGILESDVMSSWDNFFNNFKELNSISRLEEHTITDVYEYVDENNELMPSLYILKQPLSVRGTLVDIAYNIVGEENNINKIDKYNVKDVFGYGNIHEFYKTNDLDMSGLKDFIESIKR